jgi:hypothetical protein
MMKINPKFLVCAPCNSRMGHAYVSIQFSRFFNHAEVTWLWHKMGSLNFRCEYGHELMQSGP